MIAGAAAAVTPHAAALLDIGCGAGNYSLKLLQSLPGLNVTLIDLSRPMLNRAIERVSAATPGSVTAIQGDIRELDLGSQQFDIVVAAAVLHHLRTDAESHNVFEHIFAALRPGGSFWIADLVEQVDPRLQSLMWRRYGEYLAKLKDDAYRQTVFDYVAKEDNPGRSFGKSICCIPSAFCKLTSSTKTASLPRLAASGQPKCSGWWLPSRLNYNEHQGSIRMKTSSPAAALTARGHYDRRPGFSSRIEGGPG